MGLTHTENRHKHTLNPELNEMLFHSDRRNRGLHEMPFIFAFIDINVIVNGTHFSVSIFPQPIQNCTHVWWAPELSSINNIYKTEKHKCIIFFIHLGCCCCCCCNCTKRSPNNLWMCHKNLMNTIIHPYARVWWSSRPVLSHVMCVCVVYALSKIFNSYSYITHFIHLLICEALESVLLLPPPLILFRDAL